MSSVNKVILIGNLGADPEAKRTQDGKPVVNLRIATSESWRDKSSGERKERTEWHRVTIWNEGLCKVAESYLKKGSKVYLEGQLQTRKWTDKDGQDKYSTEVVLQGFGGVLTMLDAPKGQASEEPQERADPPRRDPPRQDPITSGPAARSGGTDWDPEIPFLPERR